MSTNPVTWRKSSFSGGGDSGGGDCVEAARFAADQFALRDSKAPDAGTLRLPRSGMTALLTAITA
ncbi:DUF397 domain-containing protein [Actinokineospora sp. 24-640]